MGNKGMGKKLLNLYSGYPLYSKRVTMATGLSKLLEVEARHDKISRFLSTESFDEKMLWMKVKKR
jgi:hypothetical protein